MNKFYIFNTDTKHSIKPKQLLRHSKFCIDLNRLTLILFLLISTVFINGNSTYAQCTISPTSEDGSQADLSTMGNSFTACQDGVLDKIRVLSFTNTTNSSSLKIYAGDGVDGTVLGTKSSISLNKALTGYSDWSEIDLSSLNISVINGNKYTFYFTTSVSIYYFDNNVSGGNMYQYIGGGLQNMSDDDLRFEIDIVGPSNAAPTAIAPSAPSVTEDDTNVALANDIQVEDTDVDDQTLTFTITGGTLVIGTSGITFGGGGNGSSSFTAAGTLDAINTALDAATFTPTPNLSGSNAGTISFTSNDGTDTSSAASVSFDIVATNDEPTLIATGTNPTFTEDGSAAVLFSSASASTVENGQTLSAFTFTVTNVNDGSNERLNLDGTTIVLTHGTSGTTADNSLGYSVSVVSTTATIILSGGTLSTATLQTLVNSISYQNNSNTPNTSNRVVTITSLTDSGSNVGANDNIAALGITSIVTVESHGEVTSVAVPANATYIAGQNLDFTINFDENITVTTTGGTPQISITVDATTRQAVYQSGSGSGALLFRYTPQLGDLDVDGITVGTLALNGGLLENSAENDATLTLNNVGSTTAVLVDANPPSITSSIPSDDATNATLSGNIILTFDDNMVAGTGNITIKKMSDNSVLEQIPVDDAKITISTNQVTINPAAILSRGQAYYIEIDATTLNDAAGNSFAGISGNSTLNFTTVDVVINEVVTDPQQDWSTNGFDGTINAGAISDGTDEWIELLINSDGIDLTGWTLELLDGTNVIGDLTNTGAFDDIIYAGTGSFNYTNSGDYLVLGNVDGTNGAMNNTGLTINLKDPSGALVDAVVIGGGAGQAPSGNATNIYNESVQRYTDGLDTDAHDNDFTLGMASLGYANTGPSVTLSASPTPIAEAAGISTLTATLSAASSKNVTVTLAVDGTSTAVLADYTLSSNSIVITAGSTTGTATITATQDSKDENNETVIVNVTGVTNGQENGTQQKTVTINDDDDLPGITFEYAAQNSIGESGIVNMKIIMLPSSGRDVTIPFTVNGSSTATGGVDYTISSSPIVIPAGSENVNVVVNVVSDAFDEENETLILDMGSVDYAIPQLNTSQTLTLIDDDATPSIAFNATSSNGSETLGSANLQVDLSAASGLTVTVDYTVTGTATGADYTLADGTLTMTAGDVSGNITIASIVNDLLDENNETVIVTLSSPTNATLGTNTVHTYTINDNDATPSIEFNATSSNGSEALASANLQVDLSAPSGRVVTVDYTVTGTATGADYTLIDGTLSMTAGEVNKNITIASIVNDLLDENNETVIVTLSSPVNATLGTNTVHTYTINDNDVPPLVSLSVSQVEIGEAEGSFKVIATLSAISSHQVQVFLSTDGSAIYNASHPDLGDYIADGTSIYIEPGYLSNFREVSVIQDNIDEDNETIIVDIASCDDGIEDGVQQQTITIVDDDSVGFTLTETAGGTAVSELGSADSFTVVLEAQPASDVVLDILSGDTGEATVDKASIRFTSALWNVPQTINLIGIDDDIDDGNQNTTITLSVNAVSSDDQFDLVSDKILTVITEDDDETPIIPISQSFDIAEDIANSGVVGTALATDADAGTSFSGWTESGGTGAALFEINSGTGAITVTDNSSIDYETTTSYTYTVSVSDGTNTSAIESITINITDENDVNPVITASQTFNIDEDESNTTSIGTVLATDGDVTATTFSSWVIATGNTNSVFAINSSTGELTVNDANELDYETTTSYTLTLRVSDGTNTSAIETIVVDVNPINDNNPVVAVSQSRDIEEDIVNGGVVGTALATDADAGTSFSGWTESGGTGAAIFEINSATGAITVTDNSSIDYETTTSYTYIITVTDGTNTSAVETITINITDENDVNPVVTASQTFNIDEDEPNTTSIGTVLATDGDVTATTFSSWTITAGNTNNVFAINSSTGEITVNDANELDYETITSYTLTLRVSDGTNTSATETIVVDVNPINDNNPVVIASQSFDIAEDIANSGVVGTALATDADAGTSFSGWTESGGTGAAIFEINSGTGAITVTDNSSIDYETITSYTYTVSVSDGTNTSAIETITINITDVNDVNPVVTASQTFNIDEDEPNTTSIGTVLATDGDVTATTFSSWAIAAGNTNSVFAINSSTGELKVEDNSNLDFEKTISYTLSVTVNDGTNTSATEDVVINVNDINDEVPVVTASQSFAINETAGNAASVGTILATDTDAGTVYSSWIITSGNDDGIFTINSMTGEISVADNSTLDFETTTSYNLSVKMGDGVNTSSVETVTVEVNDINDEVPVIIASQSFSVKEDADNNTSVGSVLVSDADAGTTYSSWTITGGNDDAIFAISPISGEIFIDDNSHLSFMSAEVYNLSIHVSDGLNVSQTEYVTVNIINVNNNAPVITPSQKFTISEDAINTTIIGRVLASDTDAGTFYTNWTIVSGNEDAVFSIHPGSGEISVEDNSNLDFESTSVYTLGISVSDGLHTSSVETVRIDVEDINDEAPIVVTSQSFSLKENAANNTSLGIVSFTDGDTGTVFSACIISSGNDDKMFAIHPTTGNLSIVDNSKLDFEFKNRYILGVCVSDGMQISKEVEVMILVKDINERPIANAGENQLVAENTKVTLNAWQSVDPEDVELSFKWSVPEGIELSSEFEAVPIFIAPEVSTLTDFVFTLIVDDGELYSEESSVVVSVDNVTGIEEVDFDEAKVSLYPNPSKGAFYLELNKRPADPATLSIISSSGQLAYSQKLYEKKTYFNLSLKSGMYLLKIGLDDKVIIRKIIINQD